MDSIAYITSRKIQYDLKDIEARRTKLDKKDLPKNVSSFLNDEGYVNKTVDDLINYYTKSETYTKEEVQELISTRILIKIVDKLPESNISTSTIYFLKRPKEDLPQSQYQSDVYDEYIYVDATWELIGNTYVDLTPYYTKEEVEVVIDNKILEERLIRENAEFTLQNNIDALEQKTDSEITQIKQINLNQDNSISTLETNLQNEITRATNKENELSDRCDNFDLHIENNENPHNVTKTQIGLSDVENLPIDNAPTLNSENYVKSGGVFNALENKVDKIEGKGLSDENFTYAEKTKLSNLSNYDDTEIVNNVNANTSAISILNSDSTVNGSIDNKIKNALLDVSGLQFNVVEELPTTGENGIIYFVLNTSINGGENYYDEYIWINNKFELLGQTVIEVDLSNYHTKAEISALLSGKLDNNVSSYNVDFEDYSTLLSYSNSLLVRTGLNMWNYIKRKIESVIMTLFKSTQVKIESLNDLSLTSYDTDPLTIGIKTGNNIGIDNNQIQSRYNGAVNTLYLNAEGGDIALGSGEVKISSDGKNYDGNSATATGVKDFHDSRTLKFSYATAGLSSANWIWATDPNDTTNQRVISPSSLLVGKATQDSAGQQINETYIKGLSISGKTITYTKGDNTTGTLTIQDTNTTYSNATRSTPGLMSSIDKIKLDGIASGANAYTHPTTSGNKHIPSGGAKGQILHWSSDGEASWKDNYGINLIYTCDSYNTNANKTVDVENFKLEEGVFIRVKFACGNNKASPTLNVEDTGAKEIRVQRTGDSIVPLTSQYGGLNEGAYYWKNNTVLDLIYNGRYWVAINNPIVDLYINNESMVEDTNYDYYTGCNYKIFLDGYKKQWGTIKSDSDGRNGFDSIIKFHTKFYDTLSFYENFSIPVPDELNLNEFSAVLDYRTLDDASGESFHLTNSAGTKSFYPIIRWNAEGY